MFFKEEDIVKVIDECSECYNKIGIVYSIIDSMDLPIAILIEKELYLCTEYNLKLIGRKDG